MDAGTFALLAAAALGLVAIVAGIGLLKHRSQVQLPPQADDTGAHDVPETTAEAAMTRAERRKGLRKRRKQQEQADTGPTPTAGAGAGAGAGEALGDEEQDDEVLTAKQLRKQERAARKAAMAEQRERNMSNKDKREAAYRAKQAERDAAIAAKEEQERLAEEARKQEQQEEYDSWKTGFTVEGAGEADSAEVEEAKLEAFVSYIQRKKVVVLEDLAAEFGLRSRDVLDRVTRLEQMGRLTGVVDDRGKFICVTPEEMDAVAALIKERGRISISELAAISSQYVDLTEVKEELALDDDDDE